MSGERIPWPELAALTGFADWREMLVKMYRTHGTHSMAERLGVNRCTIRYHLRRMGIQFHKPGGDQKSQRRKEERRLNSIKTI